MTDEESLRADLDRRVEQLLTAHGPRSSDRLDFLRSRFDAGLAWVQLPEGLGGLGQPRSLQTYVAAPEKPERGMTARV